MKTRLPRLQSLFMLLIAVLLFLNILLPARYTVQLVRLVPISQDQEANGGVPTTTEPATPSSFKDERLQQRQAAVKLPQHETANEKKALSVKMRGGNTNRGKKVTTRRPPLPRKRGQDWSFPVPPKDDGDYMLLEERKGKKRSYQEEMRERLKDYKKKEEEAEKEEDWEKEIDIHDERESMREKYARDAWYKDDGAEGHRKINFHDPSQRMAYYKKLRRGFGAGPHMINSYKETRHQRRLEMVREMWDGWFEEDSQVTQLGGLKQYITEDISPEAIKLQLNECATALGVSSEHLHTQQDDMQKTSKKLSMFLSAVRSLVPTTFASNFSSPCWYSHNINSQSNVAGITARVMGLEGHLQILPNQASFLAQQAFGEDLPSRLQCLPHFFLAGFPKSATTTLSDVLFSHPKVSGALIKETHWWTRAPIISPDESLLKLNVLRYMMHFHQMAHFARERTHLLSMDGSQSTLWDSNFVFNGHDFCSTPLAISRVLPKAKFIILMREPSERLYSYYLWSCSFKYGNDTREWPPSVRRDPAGNFHTEVTHSIAEFNRCRETNSLYECANKFTFKNSTKATQFCGQIGFRLVVSIYYIHIVKFLQFFPRHHFLFLKMEDMSKEPFAFLRRVTEFLEISPYPVSEVRDSLERKRNKQRAGIEPMQTKTRDLLHKFFTPYNRQLAELLNDDRYLWDYS